MMGSLDTFNFLSSQAGLECAEDITPQGGISKLSRISEKSRRNNFKPVISEAVMSGGKRIPLLKTLQTSSCERNCYYCPFRAGRDFHRATLKPDEMAKSFTALNRAGIAKGIFLSSGIAGGSIRTQDQLLATAELLRYKQNYTGYMHLKLMPGAEHDQILHAMQLADRVSVNLEAPNTQRLAQLAPRKAFLDELLQPMRWVEEIRMAQSPHLAWKQKWPSMTTQFVVGAVGESDLELLHTTSYLFQDFHLSRVYFSTFNPIPDTPLENSPAESYRRSQRLYQASFLLRDYAFDLEDFAFDGAGNLPQNIDPKTAWAKVNLAERPLEVNNAGRHDLLRIPGIGPKGADAILKKRQKQRLKSIDDLKSIGINPSRAIPYILLDGLRPARQLMFW
jgi:predicted DNA-binding helix-hairpin-helix protein